jgi:hypothetical protein
VGRPATHAFDIDVELPERTPQFTEAPGDVTLTTGDDHVIVAVISGVPTPNVYVTDEDGNLVEGEAQIVEVDGKLVPGLHRYGQITPVDDETVRFSLKIPDIQVCGCDLYF